MAYLDDDGNLNVVGRNMTFTQAIAKLGITGATNTLKNKYKYNTKVPSSAESQMTGYGKYWGIYTNSQAYAKALAVVFGCDEVPEVHGDGYYGHYHDSTHSFHIWFGNPISY